MTECVCTDKKHPQTWDNLQAWDNKKSYYLLMHKNIAIIVDVKDLE